MDQEKLIAHLSKVRNTTPLVQAITNYVTINDCANILLALGASPAMCESKAEAYEFSTIASAVYLNIGILTEEQEKAMAAAMKGAASKNVPVILDPVACGAISRRSDFVKSLKDHGKFAVIKGNAGEIKALAGHDAKMRGVDSIDEGGNIEAICQQLAKDWGCVVAASGAVDVISDGRRTEKLSHGTAMFTKITGAGCMLGALCAAFCGANKDYFEATVAAFTVMGFAGEKAAEGSNGNLPGSFRVNLMDQIHLFDGNNVIR